MEEKEFEKMTAPELREYILQNYPEITGVHALKKEELLAAIYKAKGIVKEIKKKEAKVIEINKSELKKQIRLLKAEKEKLLNAPKKSKKELSQIRKKIKRLKRLTQKAA